METMMPAAAEPTSAPAAQAELGGLAAGLTDKLRALRDTMLTGLVERDVAVRLALLAALAGEHLLLVGLPGTAKSQIARRLRQAFRGASFFERLLTRFTVPEELFGPLSIKGLEEDRYERLTDSYLPTASIAFLDEIFKANSAILNALLTLLNEREFDNGSRREKTPLVAVVGASNELPEGEELDALFDRFLLRLHLGPVSAEGFPRLLALRGPDIPEVPESLKLTAADLAAVQAEAEKVGVPPDVERLLCDLREWCAAEKITVSDRRWRKVVKLLQVSALSNGRERVSIWDCWLLQHCLWGAPEQREKVYAWYADRVGAISPMDPALLTRWVVAWEGKLKAAQESRSQVRDKRGRNLYKGIEGKPTIDSSATVQEQRNKQLLYLAPAQCWRGSYKEQQISDRTNSGRGFTSSELDQLYVDSHLSFSRWPSRDSYLVDVNNWLMVDKELVPLMEPTRYSKVYVEDRIAQIISVFSDASKYHEELLLHIDSMTRQIRSHLWVTDDFSGPASLSLERTRVEVEALIARVEQVRKGFELLPQEIDTDVETVAGDPNPKQRHKG